MAEFTRVTSTDETLRRAIQELQDAVTALRRDGRKRAEKGQDAAADVSALRGELARKLRKPNTLDFNDVFRPAGPAHALGYVPDPGAGDTGGLRFLSDDGTWKTPLDGLFWVLPEELTDPGTRKGGFNGSFAVASALAADSLHSRLIRVGNEPYGGAGANFNAQWISAFPAPGQPGIGYVDVEAGYLDLYSAASSTAYSQVLLNAGDVTITASDDIFFAASDGSGINGNIVMTCDEASITGQSTDGADVPLTVAGSSAASSVLDPAALSPTAWFKADAEAYNVADTTLATNGQDVVQWKNQAADQGHLDTADTNPPSWIASELNGQPVLRFVASNSESLTHAAGEAQGWITPSAGTVFTVFKPTGTDDPRAWIIYQGSTRAQCNEVNASGTYQSYNDDGSASDFADKVGTDNAWTIHTWLHTGGTLYSGANDTRTASLGSTASGDTAGTRSSWTCFLRGSGARYNFDLAELIFFDRALTETERKFVETYLAEKYNITIGYTHVYPATTTIASFKDSGGVEVARVGFDGLYVGGSKMTVP